MNTAEHRTEEQLVVFELAGESYGVEIGRVQEIDRMERVTKVPHAPAYVEGVINLRGRITPVMDLRYRLGLPKVEATPHTRVVVVKTDGETWIGLVVDAVSEVLSISQEAIEPPPPLVTSSDSAFMQGIAKLEKRLITLLELGHVLDKNFQAASLPAA